MSPYVEIITYRSTAFQFEIAPAGATMVGLNIRSGIITTPSAPPDSWMPLFSDRKIDLKKDGSIEKIRRKLQLPTDQSSTLLSVVENYENYVRSTTEAAQEEKSNFRIQVRGREMPAFSAICVDGDGPLVATEKVLAMSQANLPAEALIIVPDDMAQIAFLDVDYHTLAMDQRPEERDLDAMMNSILPRGFYGFASHGRGLKMIFIEQDGLSAKILAECAAAYVHLLDPRVETEVLCTCRHPAMPRGDQHCGRVRELVHDETIAILGCFNKNTCPPEAAEQICSERGWQVGQRYSHDHCPIDPTHPSGSPNPVVVLDHGVFCHSCKGRHDDAYRSWGQLAGVAPAGVDNPIYDAARHRAHWNHVRYLFKELKIDS